MPFSEDSHSVLLAEAAGRVGETLVVAPEREMSGVSHAITLHRPMRVRRIYI